MRDRRMLPVAEPLIKSRFAPDDSENNRYSETVSINEKINTRIAQKGVSEYHRKTVNAQSKIKNFPAETGARDKYPKTEQAESISVKQNRSDQPSGEMNLLSDRSHTKDSVTITLKNNSQLPVYLRNSENDYPDTGIKFADTNNVEKHSDAHSKSHLPSSAEKKSDIQPIDKEKRIYRERAEYFNEPKHTGSINNLDIASSKIADSAQNDISTPDDVKNGNSVNVTGKPNLPQTNEEKPIAIGTQNTPTPSQTETLDNASSHYGTEEHEIADKPESTGTFEKKPPVIQKESGNSNIQLTSVTANENMNNTRHEIEKDSIHDMRTNIDISLTPISEHSISQRPMNEGKTEIFQDRFTRNTNPSQAIHEDVISEPPLQPHAETDILDQYKKIAFPGKLAELEVIETQNMIPAPFPTLTVEHEEVIPELTSPPIERILTDNDDSKNSIVGKPAIYIENINRTLQSKAEKDIAFTSAVAKNTEPLKPLSFAKDTFKSTQQGEKEFPNDTGTGTRFRPAISFTMGKVSHIKSHSTDIATHLVNDMKRHDMPYAENFPKPLKKKSTQEQLHNKTDISVTIESIEIRSVQSGLKMDQEAKKLRKSSIKPPKMSLDEFIKQSNGIAK